MSLFLNDLHLYTSIYNLMNHHPDDTKKTRGKSFLKRGTHHSKGNLPPFQSYPRDTPTRLHRKFRHVWDFLQQSRCDNPKDKWRYISNLKLAIHVWKIHEILGNYIWKYMWKYLKQIKVNGKSLSLLEFSGDTLLCGKLILKYLTSLNFRPPKFTSAIGLKSTFRTIQVAVKLHLSLHVESQKRSQEVKKSRSQLLSFSIFQWVWIEYIVIQDGWCPLSIHIPLSGRPSPISFPVLRPHDPIANDEPSPMPSPNAHDNHGHNDSCQYTIWYIYIHIYTNDMESQYHGKRWRMIDISRCTAILSIQDLSMLSFSSQLVQPLGARWWSAPIAIFFAHWITGCWMRGSYGILVSWFGIIIPT